MQKGDMLLLGFGGYLAGINRWLSLHDGRPPVHAIGLLEGHFYGAVVQTPEALVRLHRLAELPFQYWSLPFQPHLQAQRFVSHPFPPPAYFTISWGEGGRVEIKVLGFVKIDETLFTPIYCCC